MQGDQALADHGVVVATLRTDELRQCRHRPGRQGRRLLALSGALAAHQVADRTVEQPVALAGCRSGEFQAMVTAPVQKSVISEAGVAFTGHTEYLAERLGVPGRS